MNVDATNPVSSDQADDDALSDSGSLYCPSVSDNESATDDEFSSSNTLVLVLLWKKIYCVRN